MDRYCDIFENNVSLPKYLDSKNFAGEHCTHFDVPNTRVQYLLTSW